MSVPGSNPIPFVPPSGEFDVDSVTDLNGNPVGPVIDADQGFQVNGRVQLPNWLAGSGQVCIYADELGGPFNQQVGCVPVPINPNPTDPSDLQLDGCRSREPVPIPRSSARVFAALPLRCRIHVWRHPADRHPVVRGHGPIDGRLMLRGGAAVSSPGPS